MAEPRILQVGTCFLVLLPALVTAGEPLEVVAGQDKNLSNSEQGQAHPSDGARPTVRLMAGAEKHRMALSFELKDQAARPCLGAVLRLVTDKCWPNTKHQHVRVQRLVRPFQERWASWTNSHEWDLWINPGGDFDPPAVCARRLTKDDGGEGKTIDLDVTPLVQGWQAKAFPNCGLLLTLDDESDTNVHFHAREAPDEAKRPRLLLYYAAPPPKNPDMLKISTLPALGVMPRMKLEVFTASLNKGTVGTACKAALNARGGLQPYTWTAAGLPEGLTLSPEGLLAGTPAKDGRFVLTLTVTGADRKTAVAKLELVVDPAVGQTSPSGAGPAKPPEEKKAAKKDEEE